MKEIPKEIHIIWIGGDIPLRNRQCITSFATHNHGWNVNLWIDGDQMLTGERRRLVKNHHAGVVDSDKWKEMAKDMGRNGGDLETVAYLSRVLNQDRGTLEQLRSTNKHSIQLFCDQNGLKLRDVKKDMNIGKNAPLYRQELIDRGANFGAASDILRIEILLKYGGIYVDTDVRCLEPIGNIQCHQSYPRFSAVHPVWKAGVTKQDWNSRQWWDTQVGGQEPPNISNSIIASHPRCNGLKSYRSLISRNFKLMKKSDVLRTEYLDDVRKSTIKMTGPTAAAASTGFRKASDAMFNKIASSGSTTLPVDDKLEMRDNWYFPMYYVKDEYFHDWL
jgi:hypothetical protein